jgi:hypothetical protein
VELTLLAVMAVALLLALALDVRRRDRRHQQDLERNMVGILTSTGRATLDEIGMLVAENKHVLVRYHERSRGVREAGSLPEVVEWIRYGCEAIERLAPDFVTALNRLRRLARGVSVIVDLPPLGPYTFRAWELRGLAGIGGVLHRLLVTGQERMRLRLAILAHAFGMSLRWLRRSTDRVTAEPERGAEWQRIDALVHDVIAAGDETELAAQRIVQALDAAKLKERAEREPAPSTGSVGSP